MKKETRKQEIINSFKSCRKELYYRDEALTELLALQRETVEMTFNKDHSEISGLRIYDVTDHLEKLNMDYSSIATEQLEKFKNVSKKLCNQIKSEISGAKGENLAEKYLREANANSIILRNIELSDEEDHTEIDIIVIKPGGISIIEVKNSTSDVFIDRNGDYYRTGEYAKYYYNLDQKMKIREKLVRQILENAGYKDVPIESILLFTNNSIEVHNKCENISTYFLCQLSTFVYANNAEGPIDMIYVSKLIRSAVVEKAYPLDFDAEEYKEAFADLFATLECAAAEGDEGKCASESIDSEKENTEQRKSIFASAFNFIKENPKKVAVAAATFCTSIITGIAATLMLNKRKG